MADDIGNLISEYASVQTPVEEARMDDRDLSELIRVKTEAEEFDYSSLGKDLDVFQASLKEVETPEHIYGEGYQRTGAKGSGSSAFGPHQITKTLLDEGKRKNLYKDKETFQAYSRLRDFGDIALKVGGKDRQHYEREGTAKNRWAKKKAKELGFEGTDDFLTAFDYGGDFGFSENPSIKSDYQKLSGLLLREILERADGDPFEAARKWHGADERTPEGKAKNDDYVNRFADSFSDKF